jgi:hypothetical protein
MEDTIWDEQIAEAWTAYQDALGLALDSLKEGDTLTIELAGDGPPDDVRPYVQVLATNDEYLLEVSSNRVLSPSHHLDTAARDRLADLAFSEPTDTMPNHWIWIGDSDFVALVAGEALRDVIGALHPSFLAGTPILWQPETPTVETIEPTGPKHLKALINQTLTQLVGQDPAHDEDGDIPIRTGHSIVYVLADECAPVIHLQALMAIEITRRSAAHRAVGRLNRKFQGVKFVVDHDRVMATADLIAAPFVPEHLTELLPRMCEIVATHDVALAKQCGGRTLVADEPEDVPDEDIHPVMLTLLHLSAERPLTANIVARACDNDPKLICELMLWNVEQEVSWRHARDAATAAGDVDKADACEHERADAEGTIQLMREALALALGG